MDFKTGRKPCFFLALLASCGGQITHDDVGFDATSDVPPPADAATDTTLDESDTPDACSSAALHVDTIDTPTAVEVVVPGDTLGASGIFNPSISAVPGPSGYMTFSAVSSPSVWWIETAYSPDGGSAWLESGNGYGSGNALCDAGPCTIIAGPATTVIDPSPENIGAEAITLQQFYVYDPAAAPPEQFTRGYISRSSDYSPIQLGSPVSLLFWNDDPVSQGAPVDLRQFSQLSDCVAFGEPSAIARGPTTIDVALTCQSAMGHRIVLLRSSDHAKTFSFVATLLKEQDAIALGGTTLDVDAPELFDVGGNSYLVVSTWGAVADASTAHLDACVTVKLASSDAVARDCSGKPIVMRRIVEASNRSLGACSFSLNTGYYASVRYLGETRSYRIYATGLMTP